MIATPSAPAATPADLLAQPLDWFVAEHARQRLICDLIEEVADEAAPDRAWLTSIADYLAVDLPLHLADEEVDFFPLLRRRCGAEIGAVLSRLAREHRADIVRAGGIGSLIGQCLAQEPPGRLPAHARRALRQFAADERRHLGLENAVLLPIARLRLDAGDLAELGARLAARRGAPVGQTEVGGLR